MKKPAGTNGTNLTLRNLRAVKKLIAALALRVHRLEMKAQKNPRA